MSKEYKVTLSVVCTVLADNKEEAIRKAKWEYDYWWEDGYLHSWDSARAEQVRKEE